MIKQPYPYFTQKRSQKVKLCILHPILVKRSRSQSAISQFPLTFEGIN
ncbi:hypothetical protein [Calothrix sp. NIES-3974]|nr:hypothetical protein [Calothrix sp. NIES-3974]